MKKLLNQFIKRNRINAASSPRYPFQSGLDLEVLEPRVLFSGAPVEPAVESDVSVAETATPVAEDQATDSSGSIETGSLSNENFQILIDAAKQRWVESGISAEQAAALDSVTYQIADLSGSALAKSEGLSITIDINAAGNGWYVDAMPFDDSEFTFVSARGSFEIESVDPETGEISIETADTVLDGIGKLTALTGSVASGDYDLLSVILHEQGHILGLGDTGSDTLVGNLMAPNFLPSLRLLPMQNQAASAIAGPVNGTEFASGSVLGTVVTITADGTNTNSFTVSGTGELELNGGSLGIQVSDITELNYTGTVGAMADDRVQFNGLIAFDFSAGANIIIGSDLIPVDRIDIYADINIGAGGSFTGHAEQIIHFDADISGTDNSAIITDDGDIFLKTYGIGGAGQGVLTQDGAVEIKSNSGNITIEGIGRGTNDSRRGVFIGSGVSDGTIISTVSGDITIRGTGGGTDDSNEGVRIENDTDIAIVTTSGNILIEGTAGGGTVDVDGTNGSDGNNGVLIQSRVESLGSGTITIRGTGSFGVDDADGNDGVEISNNGALIRSAGGAILIQGTGGGIGALSVLNTSLDNMGVRIADGTITATNGASITIEGTGGEGHATARGVYIDNDGESITSVDGDITIRGIGGVGNTAEGNALDGVRLDEPVTVTGTGNIFIFGTGGSGGSGAPTALDGAHRGVVVSSADATLTTTSGKIEITGTGGISVGGDQSDGVLFGTAGDRVVTGTGDITIIGEGGVGRNTNRGVVHGGNAIIRSDEGAILIRGTGGSESGPPTAAGDSNHGVDIDGIIRSTGTGVNASTITIEGFGGIGDTSVNGIDIDNPLAEITTIDGAIILRGTGRSAGTTTGDSNVGIRLDRGLIESTGAGTISIDGTGGTGDDNNRGILIEGDLVTTLSYFTVRSATADITISGTGGGGAGGSSSANQGVTLDNLSLIDSTAGAKITISGTGGNSTGAASENRGVAILDGASVQTTTGDIVIVGEGSGADDAKGVLLDDPDAALATGGMIISKGSGNITIQATAPAAPTAEHFEIAAATSVIGGALATGNITILTGNYHAPMGTIQSTGNLTIAPLIASREIEIGATTSAATSLKLEIADDEIAVFAPGFASITIGDTVAGTGSVDVKDATFLDPLTLAGGTIFGSLGLVAPAVTLDGDLAPGTGVAGATQIFAVTGVTTLTADSSFTVDIASTTPGTGHDQLAVVGSVNIAGKLTVFQSADVAGDIVIIDNNGTVDAVVGTFDGFAQGALVTATGASNQIFRINYAGGDGNDVVLEYVGTPTTGVALDGSGKLTISDDLADDSSDNISLRVEGGFLVIVDPDNILGTSGLGSGGLVSLNEVRISTTLFNDIEVLTGGGADIINLGSLSGLPGSISVDGGDGQDLISYRNATTVLADDRSARFTAEQFDARNGNITVGGTGSIIVDATGTGSGDFTGVRLYSSDFTATGSGSISISGEGGDTGNDNHGVWLTQKSALSIATGDLTITGSTQAGAGTRNDGVRIGDTSTISQTGTGGGFITITGTSNAAGTSNNGVYVGYSSSITAVGTGSIAISGTGADGTSSNDGILISRGSSLLTENGGITLIGNGGNGRSGNNGISTGTGVTIISSGSGNLSLAGTGGSDAASDSNRGISLQNSLLQTVTGSVALTGISGAGTDDNVGVLINDSIIEQTGAPGTGTFTIDGTGNGSGKDNIGIQIALGSEINARGASTLAVTGKGGNGTNYNAGISITHGSQVTSQAGDLTISGTGGDASGRQNRGIRIDRGAVSSSGASVFLRGTGGTGRQSNEGILIVDSTGISASGTLDILGTGGNGTGKNNHGVSLRSSTLSGTSITVGGTGGMGAGSDLNHGILTKSVTLNGAILTGIKGLGDNSEDTLIL